MPVDAGIYRITNIANGKFYIGSSVSIKTRRRGHLHHLRRGTHTNPRLQAAFNKYGEGAFRWDVILTVDDVGRLLDSEQHAIDTMRPEYNVATNVERPSLGRVVSEHTRRLLSAANKGRVATGAQRLKMSLAQMGRTQPPSSRKKIGEARKGVGNGMYGRRHSPTAIAKIAAASRSRMDRPATLAALNKGRGWNRGIPFPEASRRKMSDAKIKRSVVRIDPRTQVSVRYDSASAAKRDGFHAAHIGKCCKGLRPLHKGFAWAYA